MIHTYIQLCLPEEQFAYVAVTLLQRADCPPELAAALRAHLAKSPGMLQSVLSQIDSPEVLNALKELLSE